MIARQQKQRLHQEGLQARPGMHLANMSVSDLQVASQLRNGVDCVDKYSFPGCKPFNAVFSSYRLLISRFFRSAYHSHWNCRRWKMSMMSELASIGANDTLLTRVMINWLSSIGCCRQLWRALCRHNTRSFSSRTPAKSATSIPADTDQESCQAQTKARSRSRGTWGASGDLQTARFVQCLKISSLAFSACVWFCAQCLDSLYNANYSLTCGRPLLSHLLGRTQTRRSTASSRYTNRKIFKSRTLHLSFIILDKIWQKGIWLSFQQFVVLQPEGRSSDRTKAEDICPSFRSQGPSLESEPEGKPDFCSMYFHCHADVCLSLKTLAFAGTRGNMEPLWDTLRIK